MAAEVIFGIGASATSAPALIAATAPVTRRVRAFFAPVLRATGAPAIFDASQIATFTPSAPAVPWVDLGWCASFSRRSGTTVEPLVTGAPGMASGQVRTLVDATVELAFESWGKLQLALTAGVQQMNVLVTQAGTAPVGSGGAALAAVPLTASNGVLSAATTAASLDVGMAAAAAFPVGSLVVVDVDYTGQTGFVGSGVSGGYVKSPALIGSDVDYIRRVSLNVGRVVTNASGVLGLGSALLAGVPVAGMQVSAVAGFCDREGGSFFQEWSALFLIDGAQGDRVVLHYPRLQAMAGTAERIDSPGASDAGLERRRLAGSFRALPVTDANDGERIVCYRTYLPGPMRAV